MERAAGANILKDGYPTIGQLEDALIDASRRSAYERAFANNYANAGGRKDGGEGGNAAIKSASSPSKAGRPVRSEYYNMQGRRNPYRRGAYIRRDTYGNGSSQSQKLFEKSSNSTNNSIEK